MGLLYSYEMLKKKIPHSYPVMFEFYIVINSVTN